MPEISDALAELRRLGMHLDPAANATEAQARRVRLNTRVFPLYRALGFQVLLVLAVLHNAAVFGRVGWSAVLPLAAVVELYVVLAWVAIRRWFSTAPELGGWDVSDLFFLADLVLWAWLIAVTGADRSWLFLLPLLRVADHRGAPHVFAFAWLAPLSYIAVLLWAALQPGGVPAWDVEALKVGLLASAGLYIALTGQHVRRLQEQRGAALKVAAGLLGQLRERTERLDQANRARGDLLARVRDGLGAPLIEIVGFSQSLLRGAGPRGASEEDYLQRIHQQGRWVLRILDDLPELPDLSESWPKVSLAGLLQEAVSRESEVESDDGSEPVTRRDPAELELPEGDVEIRTDPRQLSALIRHLLSAARHYGAAAPSAVLRLDPATGLAESIDVEAAEPAPAAGDAANADPLNPFSAAVAGNQREVAARLELTLARSLVELLGYRLAVSQDPGFRLTVWLR